MENLFKQIDKAVVNVGVGKLSSQANFAEKILPEIAKELASITGQKPSERPAKKSIATFKLRQGTIVGLQVTLRGQRMEHFIQKVNNVVLPRVRDFRGISLKKIDENGNLSIGIKEHVVFPEVKADATNVSFGLQITIVLKQRKDQDQAVEFYRKIGTPLKK
jgi:large subunit ribosomal protein L5